MPKLLRNYPIHFTVAGLVAMIIAIATFVFNATGVYEQVNYNTDEIQEIKTEVKKIPVIETKLNTLVTGQQDIINLLLKKN